MLSLNSKVGRTNHSTMAQRRWSLSLMSQKRTDQKPVTASACVATVEVMVSLRPHRTSNRWVAAAVHNPAERLDLALITTPPAGFTGLVALSPVQRPPTNDLGILSEQFPCILKLHSSYSLTAFLFSTSTALSDSSLSFRRSEEIRTIMIGLPPHYAAIAFRGIRSSIEVFGVCSVVLIAHIMPETEYLHMSDRRRASKRPCCSQADSDACVVPQALAAMRMGLPLRTYG